MISLFTVLSIVGAKISLPILAIPFTFQFIISLLTGIVLGARRALIAQGLYLAMGLIGLPVFAKGGGLAYILEPSFGYLIGMALGAGVVGFFADRLDRSGSGLKIWKLLPVHFLALAMVYSLGVGYLYLIKNFYVGQNLTFVKAVQFGMIPFMLNDSIYCVFAAVVGPRLRRIRPVQPVLNLAKN
jgi:biotin transport system substrate-specific component